MTTSPHNARISVGTRDLTEYAHAWGDCALRDAGILPPGYRLHAGVRDLVGQSSLVDLARTWFDAIGIQSWRGQPEGRIIDEAIRVSREIDEGQRDAAHGTSTWTDLLQNVAQGALLIGWSNIRPTWREICREIIVQDFRPTPLAGPSELQLAKLGPMREIAHMPASSRSENVQAVTHAGIFSLSREAQTNDLRGALVVDAKRAGEAAAIRVNQELFALLATASGAGPTLGQTGRALFNTTDGTLAASGGALSVATLDAGRKAMRRQTDPTTSRRLNIAAATLMVPPSLEATARVLVAADNIPGDPNNLRVAVDAELEAISVTAWYLLADPKVNDALAVAFLQTSEPSLESKFNADTDGLEYKVRIDFAPVATDFRGCYRNAGA